MLLPTSKTYTHGDFKLSTGETLPDLTIAYETWGTLNAAGDNAILVCHGYTNFPHATGDARASLWTRTSTSSSARTT